MTDTSTTSPGPSPDDREGGQSLTEAHTAHDIRPGDVILHVGEAMTVHEFWPHPDGSASLRARYTCNPRGIDWRCFVEADVQVPLLSRGVARVDGLVRSLLP